MMCIFKGAHAPIPLPQDRDYGWKVIRSDCEGMTIVRYT